MSTGQVSSHKSRSSHSKHPRSANHIPPQPTLTPQNIEREFEPCAATSSYLLYAQRNIVLCLHHDTLAIERRFDRHLEDVQWIAADTVSERGAGRLAVSYDAGHTAIVWNISTGDEVARFAAYEEIRVATWMRNGCIAFGNVQGNVILFEPSTSEHISARTIYDPITAIAPVSDNRTFAIGYLNGSILVATLQPFTMVHSLNTSNAPSRVTGLAWHASSTGQKSDMLATQTADGNIKVWSIPKVANGDTPNIIRILNRPDNQAASPCWFGWSKAGRIVHHAGGETRSWDVRTKHISFEAVPTHENVVGIANCGPTSTLFTLGYNHTVQQYDITPGQKPIQIAAAQHAPAKTPPSPPNSIEEARRSTEVAVLPTAKFESVGRSTSQALKDGESALSPLQRLAKEMDQLEDERRDNVGPLSPVSSRASSVSSSRSSEGGRRAPSYRFDRPPSSRASEASEVEGTEFSFGVSSRHRRRESVSARSTSSMNSSKYRSSGLRQEVIRSPEVSQRYSSTELFPFLKARLADVPFRTPHYAHIPRTSDVLRREMLSVVFGWNDDIELLIRDELARLPPGSANGILLSQWLGDLNADSMTSMIGSESMTSADWMLLALSTMGHASQKKVGEAFVHRLLEKGDIHPAVAILVGLGEDNDAIEVYVSRNYYMEAVLLTCLIFPSDWRRQSYLVRKWGEILVAQSQPVLAVRCFSCTSVDSSEAWFSPRAQDSTFAAQKEQVSSSSFSPPTSPPSATGSARLRSRTGSLKLITDFGGRSVSSLAPLSQLTPTANITGIGVTPIAESAISPGRAAPWPRGSHRKERDPSSARTATPSSFAKQSLHSQPGDRPTRTPSEAPLTAARDFALNVPTSHQSEKSTRSYGRRTSSVSSSENTRAASPASTRHGCDWVSSSDRLPSPTQDAVARIKDGPKTRNGSSERLPVTLQVQVYDTAYFGMGASSRKDTSPSSARSTRREQAQNQVKVDIDPSSELSEIRGRSNVRYIRPAKTSPRSPVPMSPEEVAAATRAMKQEKTRPSDSQQTSSLQPAGVRASSRLGSRAAERQDDTLKASSGPRSRGGDVVLDSTFRGQYLSQRERSKTRHDQRNLAYSPVTTQRAAPSTRYEGHQRSEGKHSKEPVSDSVTVDILHIPDAVPSVSSPTPSREQAKLARKHLAARELEERRASLARRPSAPVIPLPGALPKTRPSMGPRFFTEMGNVPHSSSPPLAGPIQRSQTVDPEDMMSTRPKQTSPPPPSAIGLPVTPRAMRHPYHLELDKRDSGSVPPDVSVLSSAFTRDGKDFGVEKVAPLLPSTIFKREGLGSPPRAASVPLEKHERSYEAASTHSGYKPALPQSSSRQGSIGRGHTRRVSQPENKSIQSIDATLQGAEIVVVGDSDDGTILLPELRHLATPPPPPPPPMFVGLTNTSSSSVGVIDIAIEEDSCNLQRAPTTSPTHTLASPRRGRNSAGESLGARFRGVADRIRSPSQSRPKSPDSSHKLLPYETVLPQSGGRLEGKMSQEDSVGGEGRAAELTSPTSHHHASGSLSGQMVAPENIGLPPSRTGSAFQGQGQQRQMKEIRANAPPELLQQGVYNANNMI